LPPQIAPAAVRLAIADHNKHNPDKIKDRLSLSLSDACSLLDEESPIKSKLEELIKPKSGDEMVQEGSLIAQEPRSVLHELFRRLREILEYKGEASRGDSACTAQSEHNDCGLPLPLLARLGEKKPYILHNLLLWLRNNPQEDTLKEELRHRMVRYALVDHFLVHGNDEYRRQAFQECGRAIGVFLDVALIKLAANFMDKAFKGQQPEEIFAPPAVFESTIESQPDPINLYDLLLWVQRYYLYTCFPDYDPTLFFNVSALPWHRDHIWPQAKMDGASTLIEVRSSSITITNGATSILLATSVSWTDATTSLRRISFHAKRLRTRIPLREIS
jgi:hypothetical protein